VPARPSRPSGDLCKLPSNVMSWERAVFCDTFYERRMQLREKDMKCAPSKRIRDREIDATLQARL